MSLTKTLGAVLPSIPYPPSGEGYWGTVTSTINWCEEDYYATRYSAEIVNATTNAMFVALALRGFWNCYKNKHDKIFYFTFAGYLIVGLGSFAFHSSLKYPMQLVDELSMIYTTALSCFTSFTYRRSKPFTMTLGVALASLCIFITAYYHYVQDPVFHQVSYALLTATVLFRGMYIMETHLRPSFRRKREAAAGITKKLDPVEQERRDKRDMAILKTMWKMIGYGLGTFLGGFFIWGLDRKFCLQCRVWRREIGLPWGIFLEGHGWWHIMTGIGAYFYIQWGIWLRHCLNGKQDLYELKWPYTVFSIPVVEMRSLKEQELVKNGITTGNVVDGSVKKVAEYGGVMNGFDNGYPKGKVNGVSYGTASGYSNGYSNGHSNGHANGHSNGYANGNTNGYANGYANGNGGATKRR